jgi:16S rRNA C1402 (ribose-2'-O) methylase RsmI
MVMVFKVTFNNISVISWRSVLLVEETRVSKKTTDLSQVTEKLLSYNVVSSSPHLSGIRTHNFSGDRH